jgi:large repetitive protein
MNAFLRRQLATVAAYIGAIVGVAAQTITIAPTPVPSGGVGSAYSTTFSAGGGTAPYRFSVERGRLPNGMNLTEAGVLSGTPTQYATVPFEIWVTDLEGREAFVAASTSLLANVLAVNNAIAGATLNASYTQAIAVTGGGAPYSCSLASGSLPPGISLSTSCTLTGTPTTGGSYTFSVAVTDGFGGSATQSFTIVVSNALGLSLTAATGTVGSTYSGFVVASGGTAPYTCTLTAGVLPPGLALASNCAVTGVPGIVGIYAFTVQASDSFGGSGAQSFNITIAEAQPKIVDTLPVSLSMFLIVLLAVVGLRSRTRRSADV